MVYKVSFFVVSIALLGACSQESNSLDSGALANQNVPNKGEVEVIKIEVPVKIFGLALDQKLEKKIPVCTFQEIGDSRRLCWVDKPFKGVLGTLQFPKHSLPAWAEYSAISLELNPDGSPGHIEVKGSSDCHQIFLDAVNSIRMKFGAPDSVSDLSGQYPKAVWEKNEVRIVSTVFKDDLCITKFSSPKAWAAHIEYVNQMKKKEASRPLTP